MRNPATHPCKSIRPGSGGTRAAFARLLQAAGLVLPLVMSGMGAPVLAQSSNLLPVPSGQPVELRDVLLDTNPGELWLRFRFIAPKIGSTAGRITYDVAVIDMEHLCHKLAIPYVALHQLEPARVVISFSDRPIEFGASSQDITQFFEAYRLEQTRCVWEGL